MLRFDRITKYFGGRTLFEDVSFVVGNGSRVGIVGPNGSGKTTLLKIATGELEPDGGSVLLSQTSDVLFLDEPTINLDEPSIKELQLHLLSLNKSMLIVSHDRAFLNAVVERIIELDPLTARATEYGGNWDDYQKKKQDDLDRQWRMFTAQQAKIAQLSHDIRETKNQALSVENSTVNDYIRGRSKKVAAKAKARESRLNRLMEAEHKIEKPSQRQSIRIEVPPARMRDKLLFEIAEHSISLFGGQRVAITGLKGAGKTTLLNIIFAEAQRKPKTRIAYLRQLSDHLPADRTLLDWFVSELTKNEVCPAHTSAVRTYLHRFLFSGDDVFKTIGKLSSGERVRIQLAALMANAPDLILLDEPTNHLDVDSIASIEQALSHYPGAIVVISHDRQFRQSLRPEQTWHVENGHVRVPV
jgi:ATP-binding cassette subfamily F protein 3